MRNINGEIDLIKACRAGDVQAMDRLIKRYSGAVHSLIYSVIGKPDFVEDLAQETFLRALSAIKNYEFKASFKSWLFRIALNLCRDHFRRAKVRRILTFFYNYDNSGEELIRDDETLNPHSKLEQKQRLVFIHDAINKLPTELRIVLVLRDIQDLSYEEISKIIKRPMGTVKTRIFRARKQIADLLYPLREDL